MKRRKEPKTALTPADVEAIAAIGKMVHEQLRQTMKAQGMSDQEFDVLFAEFG